MMSYRCGRAQQISQLKVALRNHHQYEFNKPIVCLAYGCEGEGHSEFLSLLTQCVLPAYLNLENPIREYVIQTPKDNYADLWPSLGLALLRKNNASPEEICTVVRSETEPLMLTLSLICESFDKRSDHLLRQLFAFWQAWPNLPTNRLLINYVNLIYPSYPRDGFLDFRKRLLRKWNNRFGSQLMGRDTSGYTNVTKIVLPELHQLTRNDISRWFLDLLGQKGPQFAYKMFPDLMKRDRTISAKTFYGELREFVISHEWEMECLVRSLLAKMALQNVARLHN